MGCLLQNLQTSDVTSDGALVSYVTSDVTSDVTRMHLVKNSVSRSKSLESLASLPLALKLCKNVPIIVLMDLDMACA